MRAVVAAGLLLLSASDCAGAQDAPAFEVASIKRELSPDVPAGIRPIGAGGQFHAVTTVHDLVRVAYGAPLALLDSQVVGGPGWAKVERFDITAKIAGQPTDLSNGPPPNLLEMIRSCSQIDSTCERDERLDVCPYTTSFLTRPQGQARAYVPRMALAQPCPWTGPIPVSRAASRDLRQVKSRRAA
jgi:hypothetical protein